MEFLTKFNTYLNSRFTLIEINTNEEQRGLDLILQVCEATNRRMVTWDFGQGFVACNFESEDFDGPTSPDEGPDPVVDLMAIGGADEKGRFVFVLKDFHAFLDPSYMRVVRLAKNLAIQFRYSTNTIVLLSASNETPMELKDMAISLDMAMPDLDDLDQIFTNIVNRPGIDRTGLTEDGRDALVGAALGMTTNQALRAFSQIVTSQKGRIADDNVIDIISAKRAIINDSSALEFVEVNGNAQVGGLHNLKGWLDLRATAFSDEAKEFGLPAPKGLALIGIPGTGKSVVAKLISRLWQKPLVKLDVGALFGELVGQSERQAREALKLAEAIAPCVLWIDEIEKAFAGGSLDGGTSARVFGSILTWMQEKTSPVFVVATANNISQLPPELLRSGRFDDIFFLDLPQHDERQEIFSVHLEKRNREVKDFDLEVLAEKSQGFVGAEIEQAVINGLYLGFNDSKTFETKHIVQALLEIIPLSVSSKEAIANLRTWVKEGRAKNASISPVAEVAPSKPKPLEDLNREVKDFELELS